jgi:hypothetical protein
LERRANAAVAALGLAGREGLGAYFGAEAALKEVFHQSSDTGTRNAALWAVTQLSSPPRPETLEFFEDLAVSEDEFTASVAVQHLHQSLGQQGLAVLSRLYRAETVTAPNAVRILAWVARREGW